MVARILGSVARHESERIGERVARAKEGTGCAGPGGRWGEAPLRLSCSNPTPDHESLGCTVPGCAHDGRLSIVSAEAAEIRRVAASRLAGASWGSEVTRLAEAGLTTTTGRPWTIGTLKRTS